MSLSLRKIYDTMTYFCLNCEKEFTPKNQRAKFCSTSCRSSYWQKNKRIQSKPLYSPEGKIVDNSTMQLLNCCSSPKLKKVADGEIVCYNCGHQWISGYIVNDFINKKAAELSSKIQP